MTPRPSVSEQTVHERPALVRRGFARAGWLERRGLRYKRHPLVAFEQIRGSLRTGDIILFHKTTRNGFLDRFELDVLSPLLFEENEFRHSGIILRRNGELFALECAEEPHFGVRFIFEEIPAEKIQSAIESYRPIGYSRMQRSVPIFLAQFFLPKALLREVFERHRDEMMCSEFVHSVLNRCGVLRDFPSKLFGPYSIENPRIFKALEIVKYSDIVRFD